MQRRTPGRGLGAVLFTDIVGSTAIAAEMGNRRWSELVSRHHRILRREIRRSGGREQDTAGDGFFVTFERPVDAIRCAVAAAEAVRSIGIEIRAAVAFGQLEVIEGKAGGLIVNTAARVMAVAGPGEVLVPAAVTELLPGAGVSFADHGTHRLKGLEGDVRLFLVTEVEGRAPAEPLDQEEAAERRRAIVPATGRRAGLLTGGLAAAVVAVVVGVWAFAGGDGIQPREPATPERVVVEFDAETGSERQRVAFPDPGRPETFRQSTVMAAGQGAVWTEDPTAWVSTIFRIDPRHGEVRRVVLGPSYSFLLSITPAFEAIWMASDRLVRLNPATLEHRVVRRIPLPPGGSGATSLAADREHLWIGTSEGLLQRIDPSGVVSGRRTVGDSIELVAAGAGGVWVVDQLAGVVLRVDPESLRRLAVVRFTGSVDAIGVLGDHVWVLDFGTGVLTRISILEDRPVGQETVPADATSLAVGLDAVWVAHADGTVTKVDPLTLQPSVFAQLEGSARAIAVDEARNTVWVDVRSE